LTGKTSLEKEKNIKNIPISQGINVEKWGCCILLFFQFFRIARLFFKYAQKNLERIKEFRKHLGMERMATKIF
jgi:hypothetical protein